MTELKKSLSISQAVALAVSMVVGSGLLGLPGLALDAGGTAGACLGWLATTLLSIPLLYIFARLGLKFPSSAGLTRYAQAAAGPAAGHGVTVVLAGTFVICIPVGTLIGAAYMQRLLHLPAASQGWLAAGILLIMTLINLRGVRWASLVNSASVLALILLVALLVLTNLGPGLVGLKVASQAVAGQAPVSYHAVWSVCALLFWAYLGWENLSFGLEEFHNPKRSIPLVFALSFLIVVGLYFGLALVSIGAHAGGVEVSGAAGLVSLVNDSPLGVILKAVMVLVILANVNAWIFGASRLMFAAGRAGIFPSYLGRLSGKDVPSASLLTMLAAYVLVVGTACTGQLALADLVALVSQNFVLLYGFCILAYWRTEIGWPRWPVTVVALATCLFLLSGFGWWLLYPVLLFACGVVAYRRKQAGVARDRGLQAEVGSAISG